MLPTVVNKVLLEQNHIYSYGIFMLQQQSWLLGKKDCAAYNIYYLALYKRFVNWDLNHCLIDVIGNLPEVTQEG